MSPAKTQPDNDLRPSAAMTPQEGAQRAAPADEKDDRPAAVVSATAPSAAHAFDSRRSGSLADTPPREPLQDKREALIDLQMSEIRRRRRSHTLSVISGLALLAGSVYLFLYLFAPMIVKFFPVLRSLETWFR